MPSVMTFRVAFGSWGNALRSAGFTPIKVTPVRTRKGVRNRHRKRVVTAHGYIEVFEPTHPLSKKNGYCFEHRMFAWDNGMIKDKSMQVHHKNHNKQDNSLDNLEVLAAGEHTQLHTRGVKRPRRNSSPCRLCTTLTASRYGLCQKHYKAQWQRDAKS